MADENEQALQSVLSHESIDSLVTFLVKSLDVVPSSSEVSMKKRKLLAVITTIICVNVVIVNAMELTQYDVQNSITNAASDVKYVLRITIQDKLIMRKLKNFKHFAGVSDVVVRQTARTIIITKTKEVIRIIRSKTIKIVITINVTILQDHRMEECTK